MFYFKNMDTQVQIITQKTIAVVDTSETVKSWQLNQPWRIVKDLAIHRDWGGATRLSAPRAERVSHATQMEIGRLWRHLSHFLSR